MGLDLRLLVPAEERARWAYSGFNRFRERLAEAAELGALSNYKGFGGDNAWPSRDDEPLIALLDHSDCDGEIWGWQAEGLAARLGEIIGAWPEDDYDRQMGERLADMFAKAERSGGLVEFA